MSHRVLVVEADGGSRGNPGPAGYGAVVKDVAGVVIAERAGFLGVATNNVAEYRGLIAGLEAAVALSDDALIKVRMDSKLVVEQMQGHWKIKHDDLSVLARRAREIIAGRAVEFTWIPREHNRAADALANEAMDTREAAIVRDHHQTGPGPGPEYDDEVPADAAGEVSTPAGKLPRALVDLTGSSYVSTLSLVLVRHGVTDLTQQHVLSGSGVVGPHLNAQGRVQAAKAADAVYQVGRRSWSRVSPVTRVIASPMQRTQDTAGAIGRRIGAHVEIDERVREVDFGDWEGLTTEEAFARDGREIMRWNDGEVPAPGGESVQQVVARVDAFMRDIAAQHAALSADDDVPRSIAVASHAVAIKSFVGAALGIEARGLTRIWPQPASLTILQLRVTPEGELKETHVLCVGAPTD